MKKSTLGSAIPRQRTTLFGRLGTLGTSCLILMLFFFISPLFTAFSDPASIPASVSTTISASASVPVASTAPVLVPASVSVPASMVVQTPVPAPSSLSASDAACLDCHADPTFSIGQGSQTISLTVNGGSFSTSIHAMLGCVGCHADADVPAFPHPEGLKKVDCSSCHEKENKKFQTSIHGQALAAKNEFAPRCYSCHGKHDILSASDPLAPTYKMNIPMLCGKCHKEGSPVTKEYSMFERNVVENYRESIHGEGMFKKGLLVTATCNDCHTSHEILPHVATESTVSPTNIAKTCFKCHGMIEQVHKKIIKGELWEKNPRAIPICVDCHSAHQIRKDSLTAGLSDDDCLKCHDTGKFMVARGELASSAHAKINCIKCHSDVSPNYSPVVASGTPRPCQTAGKVDCSSCHVKQGEDYNVSIHGQLHAKNDPDAPTCTECHGKHGIQAKLSEKSPIFRRNIPDLCGTCHLTGQKAARRIGSESADLIQKFRMSAHGKGLLESGLISSAACTDCHTSHREFPSKDERSSVNKKNVGATCGKCHMGVFQQLSKSVHGAANAKEGQKVPTCIDCHASHEIGRTDKPKFVQEIGTQCGVCHKEVSETYLQTYHGKAYQLGSLKTAKCTDCHGVHDILKPENPASHLSRNNVVETCKKCHQGANRQFVGYLTHATHHDRVKYPILWLTFWGMSLLLIGTFGFFGIHTLLWLPKSLARWRQKRQEHTHEETKQYMRFDLTDRLLHLTVIISFFGLAITGMMLKFANMAWAGALASLIGGAGNAGFIHRVCAVITFGYFMTHLYLLYQHKRKNSMSIFRMFFDKNSIFPSILDIAEFIQTMGWFLGLAERPKYGRWTYWEKFDYFAVFWGVTIIGSTGLVLWFPEKFTLILPGWLINVATIIHSDEALLAVGFIFTIHFFNTHLRPDAFPMDPVIFTGRIPLSELEHDRPREYEDLKASGELEKRLAPPVSAVRRTVVLLFGMTCLSIGIILICLIIYSMIFGYA